MSYSLFINKFQPIYFNDFEIENEIIDILKTLLTMDNLNILFIGDIDRSDLTRNAAKAHSNAHLALPPRRRYRVCRLDTTRYTIAARFLSEQLPSSACFHSRFSTRRRKRRSCFNHNHVPNSITQSTLQLRPLSLDVRSTWYYRLSR